MFCRSRNAAATHSSNSLALGPAEPAPPPPHNIPPVRHLLASPTPPPTLPTPPPPTIQTPAPRRPTPRNVPYSITPSIRGPEISIARAELPSPPLPRFPPLEVFRRRPPMRAPPSVSGRHPKTFTNSDLRKI